MSRRPPKHSEDASTTRFSLEDPGLRVLVISGGTSISRHVPVPSSLRVGRDATSDIRINHPSVSRAHATLQIDRELVLEDLGSRNGTRVAGKRIDPHQRTPVALGALVELGEAVLVVHDFRDLCFDVEAAPTDTRLTIRPDDGEAMGRIDHLIGLVARSTISVILSGETGVGKEVAARRIHALSSRAGKPFLGLNCAALPDPLLESELFGYERGAFSGAAHTKTGLLEAANGGTVFLDELGELPLSTQAKLLRTIETREVTRLGGLSPRPYDVRFVAATNRDVEAEIEAGRFRADLHFRLNGISIEIPPLRERLDEIPSLALGFLSEACARVQRPVPALSSEVLARLQAHSWPGNIRELRNVVDRAIVLCAGDRLKPEHIVLRRLGTAHEAAAPKAASAPPWPAPPEAESIPEPADTPTDLPGEVEALERRRIVDALRRADGNQTAAASLLGVSRRTLVYRLKAYNLQGPRKRT